MSPSIFDYILTEESRFQSEKVRIGDNWLWSFRDHVQLIFHLKNGVFYTGENDWLRAFKNVMEPILNLSSWAEDIELKDIVFYIENKMGRILSFMVKKYHDEVYVKENNLDEMFDEITESDLTYGGVLVQKTNEAKPEVFELNSVAFCDQTDILGGPIAFKHTFSPDKLRSMSKLGWGSEKNGADISIEDLIVLADNEKDSPKGQKNRSTGKVIDVYIIRGNLPEHYLKDNNNMEKWYNQLQVIAFYVGKKDQKQGVTLYRKEEKEGKLKFHTSKKVYGRALGRGEGESLLHPQIWTNFLEIHKMNLLESASKVPLYTDDQNYQNRNQIQDMENLEITTVEDGKRIYQVPTAAPANIQLIEQSIKQWYEQAQLTGSAFDPILGKQAVSGTTFKGQERTVQQGKGLHERRRGQRAKFIEMIYRDWIIPDMVGKILKGKKFLATFTNDEMIWVIDQLAENHASNLLNEAVLEGSDDQFQPREQLKQEFIKNFSKKGNKHLLEILKDEFRGIEIKLGINVAAKQKDLMGLSDKLLSIFQVIFANPAAFQQAMAVPALAKTFSDILEYSGVSQADFMTLSNAPQTQAIQAPQAPQAPQDQEAELALT